MSNLTRALMMGAAGAASADPLYVDDVFSTYLPSTATSNQPLNIDNGIDLAGEGGLVWFKKRNGSGTFGQHVLFDSGRSANNGLLLPSNGGESILNGYPNANSFDSDGFTWGSENNFHPTGAEYVSWSFRKAPGFFDVVTYTGDGVNGRQIPHALGSTPGMVIVKRTNGADNWTVQHRSLGGTKSLYLNLGNYQDTSSTEWNNTAATSTVFTVGTSGKTNANNDTYVAYIFAHDSQVFGTNEDESIIKCGTFSTDSNGMFNVDLGWEPQWLLIKRYDGGTTDWYIFDNMRGLAQTSSTALFPNDSKVEETRDSNGLFLTPTGFRNTEVRWYGGGDDFVYMAIRRPNKPPSAGTDVFQTLTYSGSNAAVSRSTNISVDLLFTERTSGGNPYALDRMRGVSTYMETGGAGGQGVQTDGFVTFGNNFIDMEGGAVANTNGSDYLLSMFKRAPGFLDVVMWVGNASGNRAIPHALGVTPELLLLRRMAGGDGWWGQYTGIFGTNNGIRLDSDNALSSGVSAFNSTSAATASNFYIGSDSSANANTENYVAYLFATLPGISKVGTYSGTGYDVNVDCGFSSGARFILIKRTSGSGVVGDWYLWDSVRGINAGNDPYILLNKSTAQVTNTDYIDPLNAGFTVTSSAPSQLNANGETYLFLAVA